MKIARCEFSTVKIPLIAPFTIADHTATDADLAIVHLYSDDGKIAVGVGAPSERVTGETFTMTEAALSGDVAAMVMDQKLDSPVPLCRELAVCMEKTPAARAAIDMALYDLWGQALDRPVVDLLGRAHRGMLTSMTLGIRSLDESLEEAREFLKMGYRVLKVKCGKHPEHDVELLRRLREEHGESIGIRVDANQGYTVEELVEFLTWTRDMNIEFVEQPLPVSELEAQRELPEALRDRLSADESLVNEGDAIRLAMPPQPASILTIKLMKCGGIFSAMRIAAIAEAAGQCLMWGCMIESRVGLAAALHAAMASPNTRYLDLDGDYDLVKDAVSGGMHFEEGMLFPLDAPGLGVTLLE